jgi:hypothetical protein
MTAEAVDHWDPYPFTDQPIERGPTGAAWARGCHSSSTAILSLPLPERLARACLRRIEKARRKKSNGTALLVDRRRISYPSRRGRRHPRPERSTVREQPKATACHRHRRASKGVRNVEHGHPVFVRLWALVQVGAALSRSSRAQPRRSREDRLLTVGNVPPYGVMGDDVEDAKVQELPRDAGLRSNVGFARRTQQCHTT